MNGGRLEGPTGFAGVRAGIGDTTLFEKLFADVIRKGALIIGNVWG